MGTVHTTLTMEEFFQLPDLPAGKRELLSGELIELPPPKDRHNEIVHRIYEALKEAASACGTQGKVRMEKGYSIGRANWLRPDISITQAGQTVRDYAEGAPMLAVEVISESNTASEIDGKIEAYLANGAVEVWIVYPGHMWVYGTDGRAERHTSAYASPLLGGRIIDWTRILE